MKKTKEVSKLVGVSKRTLQYYDDEGMLPVKRSKNHHRLYDNQALERIWEILMYKERGLELREIKDILMLTDDQKKMCLEQRMEAIREQITQLNEQERFVELVKKHGMPSAPMEQSGITYVESIAELREKMKGEHYEE